MIDPIFRNINRFFVNSFDVIGNDNDDFPERNCTFIHQFIQKFIIRAISRNQRFYCIN